MTSSNPETSATNTIFISESPSTLISWDRKPINDILRVGFSFVVTIENFPSKSDVVPLSVPTSITVAPGRGLPLLSVTIPSAII